MRISDWSSDVCSSDLVEARFRGGARWYGARVTAKNRDGTYDLHYDDGDDERRIDTKLIRRVGGVSGVDEKGVDKLDEPRETFRVGQRVDGRFRGRSWHPGRVVSVNRDGTYDLRYEDGDEGI